MRLLDDVTLRRGSTDVLRGFTMDLAAGEHLALVGPSGCGKTSLLRLLAGLDEPESGTVHVSGRRVGMVFQDPTLLPWRTALDNVALVHELAAGRTVPRGSARTGPRRSAMEALALVGLADHAGKLPREMSGGMKMRVAVARALAGGPDLVLLDEPFAAVDDFTRWELLELTSRILDDLGASVVHVTHSLSEAVFIADRIIVMSGHPAHRTTEQVVPVPRPRAGEIRFDASFGDAVAGLAGAVASTCSLTSGPRATGTAER